MKKKIITTLHTDPRKLVKMYKKITGEEFHGGFIWMDSDTIDSLGYDYFKEIIEDPNKSYGFIFKKTDDITKFDINGTLQENAIFIDFLDEDTRCMTIEELGQDIRKVLRPYKNNDIENKIIDYSKSKVMLKDSTTKKEYILDKMIDINSNTVSFSIFPITKESYTDKKSISEIFNDCLDKVTKKDKIWLAEQLNIPASTLYGKFNRDSFNAYEMIKISKILNIDLDSLKEKIIDK